MCRTVPFAFIVLLSQYLVLDQRGVARAGVGLTARDHDGVTLLGQPRTLGHGGGTYARYLPNAYSVATFVLYVADPYKAPTGHGGAHQADEHLPIDAFLAACALTADTVMALSKL